MGDELLKLKQIFLSIFIMLACLFAPTSLLLPLQFRRDKMLFAKICALETLTYVISVDFPKSFLWYPFLNFWIILEGFSPLEKSIIVLPHIIALILPKALATMNRLWSEILSRQASINTIL